MEPNAVPKAVRRLVIISSAFLVASMLISGFSAYATLAAPLRAPFVPDTVGFEGQLADSNGDPVADDDYDITFSLYSQSSGGTAVWTETQTDVTVTDGLYSVQLGSVTALDASDFEGDRWLGVKVGADSEMTPRIEIGAVPFALNARQAMGLQGRDVATTAPADGDVLTWDDTAGEWEPAVPSGGQSLTKIAEVEVTGSSVADITFSAIPGTYGSLLVVGDVRPVTNNVGFRLRVNGDTGNNYHYDNLGGGGTNKNRIEFVDEDTGATKLGNDTNDAFGFSLWVPNYAGTSLNKNFTALGSYRANNNTIARAQLAGRWDSSSAITQLQFYMSSGDIDVGSHVTLYGVP